MLKLEIHTFIGKRLLKDAEVFPQENCRLEVRESAEIELLQRRLQAIAKKL